METQNHPRPHQRTHAEINPLAAAPVAINTAAGHSPIDAAIEAQNKAIVGIVTKAMGSISNELKKQHAEHKKFYLFGETSTQVVPKKILLKFQIFFITFRHSKKSVREMYLARASQQRYYMLFPI